MLFVATFAYAFWLGHFFSRRKTKQFPSRALRTAESAATPQGHAVAPSLSGASHALSESLGNSKRGPGQRTNSQGPTKPDHGVVGLRDAAVMRKLEDTVQAMRIRLATHHEALEAALADMNQSHLCSAADEEKIADAVQKVLAPARQISRQCLQGYEELRQKTSSVTGGNPSRTDALTGLNNEYALMEWLRMMFALLSRYGHSFSVVIVNLEQGLAGQDPSAADQLMINVGQLLQNTVRETDLVFRMHGAQFAVVLPQTHLGGADIFAGRVHSTINAQLKLPVSIGVSSARADDNVRSLNDRLAAAIFAGNSNGGNRVYRHTGQHIEKVDAKRDRLKLAESCAN